MTALFWNVKLVVEGVDSQLTGCHWQQQQVVRDSTTMCEYASAMSLHDEQSDMN